MPGFVRTKADEARWSRAKEAAGKQTAEGSKSYWKLSNYIFHRMGKSGHDVAMAEMFKNELIKSCEMDLIKSADDMIKTGFGSMLQLSAPKMPSTSIPNPMKVGTQATVKKPKAKSMPDPFAKPSLFFKNADWECDIKHPSLRKLKDFRQKKHKQK